MARARSPNSIEAEEMYKNGMKLVDIAKKLDVPASTVRRWKSTQNWDGDTKKKKNERSQKKKTSARHKGGQLGNKNAVGNRGGPLKPGDKIAEKHGAYSSVYWDVLDESEKDMIEDIPMDEEMLLIEQIQLFAVRERRIMAAINKYRNMNGEVSLFGFLEMQRILRPPYSLWNACSSVMIHSNVFRYFVTSNRIMIDKCYHKEVENVVFRYFWSCFQQSAPRIRNF